MDPAFQLKRDNPRNNSNWLTILFCTWTTKLIRKSRKSGLQVADLYRTLKEDRSDILTDKLSTNWDLELQRAKKKGRSPSLLRALTRTFLLEYMIWGLLKFTHMVLARPFTPVVLALLIKQFTDKNGVANVNQMLILSGTLVGVLAIQTFLIHHGNFGLARTGMRVRIAASSLVYRKTMRLNQHALAGTAAGQVVNILSNDVIRFDFAALYLNALWIMPILVAVVSYFLWKQVGIACLAGIISITMFSIPLQGYLGKLTGQLRLKIAKKTDARVKLMSEIVSGIQVIKMYTWEKPFEKIIKLARRTEVADLTKTSYLRSIFASSMVFLERLTLFLTLMTYTLLGNNITADKVFSLAQFFNILQLCLAMQYPMAISFGSESLVSIKRLEDYLQLEEKETTAIEKLSKVGVVLSKVCASWTQGGSTLKDITVEIPRGTLCAIVGPVGAGKSSILQLLLGELPSASGKISIEGEIAYASQKPWLFAGTVRNNILFGQPYSKSRYDRVVEVCCLLKDFEQFPSGDGTVVGERGVSLSGGQRARINLARAIYRESDIYLLDDPLSAVDTHVGRQLFDECIYKYLSSKTRILITHQLQYLRKADLIVILNGGKIEAQGTFEELSQHNMNFTKIIMAADEVSQVTEIADLKMDNRDFVFERKLSIISSTISLTEPVQTISQNLETEEASADPNAKPLRDYLKSTNNVCLLLTLGIMLIAAQAVCAGADYFSAFWSQQEAIRHSNSTSRLKTADHYLDIIQFNNTGNNDGEYYHYTESVPGKIINHTPLATLFETIEQKGHLYNVLTTDAALYIYGTLIILAIVLTLSRSMLFFYMCMSASKNLHSSMFHALLRAPMRFFDTNPSGRILNRFSKDMGAIDEILPKVLMDCVQITLVMLGILINVSIANPYMIVAILFLGAVFNYLRQIFVTTAKDIKHLEGKTKSPVFSHVTSTLNGLTTIRASKLEDLLMDQFDHHQDVHTSSWYMTITCTMAFGLWLDLICVIFVGCITFSFVILKQYMYDVNGALVGLAISQSLILTGMLQAGMRQMAEAVNQLTSVERVLQYTKLEAETHAETPDDKYVDSWSSIGRIEFKDMCLKYVEDEPAVLKNLTLTIHAGEKIGIVGRTGAGKSSLIAALFRLAPVEGIISIDGVDTSLMSLHDLRKKISIIPQEPVLFSASMRYNLDPFGEFDDTMLWNVLDEVKLKSHITSLDHVVQEGGANFSLGQRQLICLARAILRRNQILVMDEATANVDQQTDSFIQETIRKKFKECTVLTIAHRLNTIMDSDRVLVMSFGNMVEFAHPHELLQIPEGYFYSMVQETGPSMSAQLRDIATATYKKTLVS